MILVINLGLKSVRAIVFDTDGRKVSCAAQPLQSILQGNWVEQDGWEWWHQAVVVVRQATRELEVRNSIRSVTVTSSSCCLVCTDKAGNPLRNAIMVSDRRASSESEQLFRAPEFRQSHNGSSEICSQPALMLPKLMWLRNNEQQTFSRSRWYLSSNDYLVFKLTGEAVTDPLNAEKFGYETQARRYPSDLIGLAGVDERKLPEVVPSGTLVGRVRPDALAEMGFSSSSRLNCYLTTYDAICAFFGSGVTEQGDACDVSGTVTSVRALRNSPLECAGSKVFAQHEELTGQYIVGGSNNLGGGLIEWAKQSLYSGDSRPYEAMESEASTSSQGARGLVFLPYLLGERAPLWDLDARGVFFGMERFHSRSDLIRSVFEGCAFSVALLKEAIEEQCSPISSISVSGGLARIKLISQIKADVLNAEIRVPSEFETTSVGAFLLCSLAMGESSSIRDFRDRIAIREVIYPDENASKIYAEIFDFFKELYEGCAPLFKKRRELLNRIQRTEPVCVENL